MSLEITSKAFDDGETIPERYTCDDVDVSPQLAIGNVPDEADTLTLVVDDPDAPVDGAFTHWLIWDLPADVTELPEDVPKRGRVDHLDDAPQGSNDFGRAGWGGPCPPEGDGPHTYRFHVYALDGELGVDPGKNRGHVDDALDAADVVAEGSLTGTYER